MLPDDMRRAVPCRAVAAVLLCPGRLNKYTMRFFKIASVSVPTPRLFEESGWYSPGASHPFFIEHPPGSCGMGRQA